MADVTVITPAILERRDNYLLEAVASVEAQTAPAAAHLIEFDTERRGNSFILNALAEQVETEWLVLLADDDTLHPNHIERCLSVSDDADVVYPYADMSSWPETSVQRSLINAPWDPVRIWKLNWIPGGCALIRTSMWRRVGGVSTVQRHRHIHDWLMWQDICNVGGRIVCLPEELWFYRYHPNQMEALVDGRR
jgi:hypothetical protein